MKEEFVPYELALKLKEIGFDEPCFGSYIDGKLSSLLDSVLWGDVKGDLEAPTFSQAFRWFRKKEFLIDVTSLNSNEYEFYIQWSFAYSFLSDIYTTYEEAELACLDKLIEIVELNQQEQ
jgi:hypothetical protein